MRCSWAAGGGVGWRDGGVGGLTGVSTSLSSGVFSFS